MLVLVLALSGCGGSDDGGGQDAGGQAPSPAASAPAPAPSGNASGKGSKASPAPPAVSKAAEQFNDCMRKQGVELPSPNPTSTPAKQDVEKIKAALRTCVKSVSASAAPDPG
ncbi:hypothetical protein [Actinomadura sp. BRA 177]|uniref:hypothetical protein n=1 Tax=Actinomadura sp. BRA 177 TaxID=2745202 RepID=UPI0015957E4D|nr:hypothetical protein [Actinomadura sp. BRA 177]NVI91903.1 hypothetical protein [Actinomadura sp. BRA 177]